MATAQLSTQSPAERRLAEAELKRLIVAYASAHQRLVATTRRWLLKRLPTAYEVVYEYNGFFVVSYSPSEHGYEGVFGIRGSPDGVKLYFSQGKDLPDPEKLLKGSSEARAIEVEGPSTLALPAVTRLFDAALSRNRVPFARTGRGPIIIRPTSAKKNRMRRSG